MTGRFFSGGRDVPPRLTYRETFATRAAALEVLAERRDRGWQAESIHLSATAEPSAVEMSRPVRAEAERMTP